MNKLNKYTVNTHDTIPPTVKLMRRTVLYIWVLQCAFAICLVTSRVYGTSLGKDSPKSTVKIAQLEKPREPQFQLLGASGESRIMTTELNSFKEEMKNMIKEMNKNITQNVSTNVSATVNAKIEELENKFSAMFTEYKTDIQALRAEVKTAKGDLNNVTERMIALEHSMEFNSGLQKENDEKQSRNLNKIKAEIDIKIK